MFENECLGELAYESTASAILMAGLFLSFFIEYAGNRLIQWHESKARPDSVEAAGHSHAPASPAARTDMVNIAVLEAGVIFHSLRKHSGTRCQETTDPASHRSHPRGGGRQLLPDPLRRHRLPPTL